MMLDFYMNGKKRSSFVKREPVCTASIKKIIIILLQLTHSQLVLFLHRFNAQCEQNASITLNDYAIEAKKKKTNEYKDTHTYKTILYCRLAPLHHYYISNYK